MTVLENSGISVAVAAFRGERHLGELLSSLLQQQTPADEVVITDDSPDDLTGQVARDFAERLPIRYFRNDRQLGINRNFERAIALCRGRFIFCCDQDDVWLPEKTTRLLAALRQNPAAEGAFCNSGIVDAELEPTGRTLWQLRGFNGTFPRGQLRDFLRRVPLSGHNIVFKSELRDRLLPFPELEPFFYDTWIGLLLAARESWAVVDAPLTCYRLHGNNASNPAASVRQRWRDAEFARANHSLRRCAELARTLSERLPELPQARRQLLADYSEHYLIRDRYADHRFRRFLQIASEWRRGRYRSYAGSAAAALADWCFRPEKSGDDPNCKY